MKRFIVSALLLFLCITARADFSIKLPTGFGKDNSAMQIYLYPANYDFNNGGVEWRADNGLKISFMQEKNWWGNRNGLHITVPTDQFVWFFPVNVFSIYVENECLWAKTADRKKHKIIILK